MENQHKECCCKTWGNTSKWGIKDLGWLRRKLEDVSEFYADPDIAATIEEVILLAESAHDTINQRMANERRRKLNATTFNAQALKKTLHDSPPKASPKPQVKWAIVNPPK